MDRWHRDRMHVSVVHALAPEAPDDETASAPAIPGGVPRLFCVALDLPPGATVGEAVLASGVMEYLPGLAPERLDLGVFNRPCTVDRVLAPGDRVEIYRPLLIDPKAARHLRVAARRKAEARARQAAGAGAHSPPDTGPS